MIVGRLPRFAGGIAASMAMLVLAAVPAAAQPERPWHHGIIEPKSDAGFLLMAARRGFAAREGLNLQILQVKDDQLGLRALLSGELDSYEGGVQGPIMADVRGADVKIIGCHWPVVPHGIMARDGIPDVAHLKGKTIAVSAPGSFPDMLARMALAKFSLARSEVRFAPIGGDRDRYNALVGGVVDAAVVSNEYMPLPSSRGLKLLLSGRDAGPDFLRICMFSSGRVLSQRREDAIRFLVAQSRALTYALAHRDETLRLTDEAADMRPDDPRPAFVFDDAVATAAIAPDLPIPMDKIAWMQDRLVELGQIDAPRDVGKMVDLDIRREAMQRIHK
jgi:NitT/TauT family transport system substrate-binding protein